jgi:hypothetical protein
MFVFHMPCTWWKRHDFTFHTKEIDAKRIIKYFMLKALKRDKVREKNSRNIHWAISIIYWLLHSSI